MDVRDQGMEGMGNGDEGCEDDQEECSDLEYRGAEEARQNLPRTNRVRGADRDGAGSSDGDREAAGDDGRRDHHTKGASRDSAHTPVQARPRYEAEPSY